MIEDKLDKDERIRLEALNQANAHACGRGVPEEVLVSARKFEAYIKGENE